MRALTLMAICAALAAQATSVNAQCLLPWCAEIGARTPNGDCREVYPELCAGCEDPHCGAESAGCLQPWCALAGPPSRWDDEDCQQVYPNACGDCEFVDCVESGGEVYTPPLPVVAQDSCPRLWPHVLVMLDVSSSMGVEQVAGAGITRLDDARTAITSSITTVCQDALLGLVTFPRGAHGCEPGGVVGEDDLRRVEVPFGADANEMENYIADIEPNGATPLRETLTIAPELFDTSYISDADFKYIILITDGGESCSGARPTAAYVQDLYRLHDIRTAVIGFELSPADEDMLNIIAAAGGLARDHTDMQSNPFRLSYYDATSLGGLTAGLREICTRILFVERCNGCDDDADGEIDESPDVLLATHAVTGCMNDCGDFSAEQCTDGLWSCTPPATPAEVPADCLDNDCDGAFDEGTTLADLACDGAGCGRGTLSCDCPLGLPKPCCIAHRLPTIETCDNIDNDCDGETDEVGPVECAQGACSALVLTSPCVPDCPNITPCVETCNDLIDDDCDGETDERDCVAFECTAVGPAGNCILAPDCYEACDYEDDNGNGIIDDIGDHRCRFPVFDSDGNPEVIEGHLECGEDLKGFLRLVCTADACNEFDTENCYQSGSGARAQQPLDFDGNGVIDEADHQQVQTVENILDWCDGIDSDADIAIDEDALPGALLPTELPCFRDGDSMAPNRVGSGDRYCFSTCRADGHMICAERQLARACESCANDPLTHHCAPPSNNCSARAPAAPSPALSCTQSDGLTGEQLCVPDCTGDFYSGCVAPGGHITCLSCTATVETDVVDGAQGQTPHDLITGSTNVNCIAEE